MPSFRNIEEALEAIDNEAATDAWEWLENNKPMTAKAIKYLIETAKMPPEKVLEKIEKTYEDSEPRARRKMELVIDAISRIA